MATFAPTTEATLLRQLIEAADEESALRAEIAEIEESLSGLRARLTNLQTIVMPDLMHQLEMSKTKYGNREYELKGFVSGSMPKEEKAAKRGIAWLIKNGGEDIIKSTVAVDFDRGENRQMKELVAELKKLGITTPKITTGVHHSTLQAWARERIRGGKPINLELLGLYAGQIVKVKEK